MFETPTQAEVTSSDDTYSKEEEFWCWKQPEY
jgi:hypothetical protein